jgi:hypothetical protein
MAEGYARFGVDPRTFVVRTAMGECSRHGQDDAFIACRFAEQTCYATHAITLRECPISPNSKTLGTATH